MSSIEQRDQATIAWIRAYYEEHGWPPTCRELIASGVSLRSTGSIVPMTKRLQARGWLAPYQQHGRHGPARTLLTPILGPLAGEPPPRSEWPCGAARCKRYRGWWVWSFE